jgi:hypothetical protein
MLAQADRYLDTIEPAVRYLQGGDASLATRLGASDFLPRGPRFAAAAAEDASLDRAFGALGTSDRARHLASLYLDDLGDLVAATVAPEFGLARYGESLARSASHFDGLARALARPPSLIDEILAERLADIVDQTRPALVGLSVPFPGNLYGALRAARWLRKHAPSVKIALGGGYVNTELRDLREPRLFDFVDYVTLDDGERPLLCLVELLAGLRPLERLKRTFVRETGTSGVRFLDGADEPDLAQADLPAPTYRGLPLARYLSVVELLNPMHRLWSDGRWNKLTVAHGCYWKRCTFCDTGLDYIARYDPASASALADRVDALVAETGATGFHFVDEAAPPLALVDLSLELLRRGRCISFWGNIRFGKQRSYFC